MANADLPPAYNSLHTSTANIEAVEETDSICEDEAEILEKYPFHDETTRLVYIQKVLTVKLLQLIGALIIMAIFVFNEDDIYYFMEKENNYIHLLVLSTLGYVVIFGFFIYCDQARRTNPYRYMFLVAHPLSFTLLICFLTTWLTSNEILAAWLYYYIAVFALLVYNIFACQTKLEFNSGYGVLLTSMVLIVMYALTTPFICYFTNANAFCILYSTIVIGLRIIYIVFNLELMTSKNYWNTITPADFVDGTINLDIDVCNTYVNVIVPKISDGFGKLMACFKCEIY